MEKKRFLFYTSWKKNISMMDDVELRRFINNLINYTENKPIDLPTRIDQMVWNDVVEVLDHNETKRQNVAEKRRLAGLKGGAPVGNNNAQKKTDVVDETNKNNQNNQMVEQQPKQTKQPEGCNVLSEGCNVLSEGCNVLSEGCNMLNEKGKRLVGIMKQVIEDGYIDEDIVVNWKITDTREILNKMLCDYQYWENDFNNLGLDGFLRKVPLKSNIKVDYILHSTLKAHEIL
jgi:hypothetical protein